MEVGHKHIQTQRKRKLVDDARCLEGGAYLDGVLDDAEGVAGDDVGLVEVVLEALAVVAVLELAADAAHEDEADVGVEEGGHVALGDVLVPEAEHGRARHLAREQRAQPGQRPFVHVDALGVEVVEQLGVEVHERGGELGHAHLRGRRVEQRCVLGHERGECALRLPLHAVEHLEERRCHVHHVLVELHPRPTHVHAQHARERVADWRGRWDKRRGAPRTAVIPGCPSDTRTAHDGANGCEQLGVYRRGGRLVLASIGFRA